MKKRTPHRGGVQAVILAGGAGTRLRPLTWTRPKPLLPVANVPLVRHILDRLPKEVDRVVLAVNYRLDLLEAYFESQDLGREVLLVEEKEPLGTGGAIKNVERHVDGTFLVFNGDVLDNLDLDKVVRFHRAKRSIGTIALHKVADPTQFGIAEVAGDRVVRFVEKPTREDAPGDLANAGTYVLEPDVFDAMPAGTPLSVERDVFPRLLAEGAELRGYLFSGLWLDCGRPETYLKANELVLRGRGEHRLLGRGVQDFGANTDDWAVVGDGCRLGEHAEISRSVLLNSVVVGRNAAVRHSVLGENVVVEDDAAVVDSVVGDGAVVARGVVLKNVKIEPGEVVGESA